jgi:hypothetical protein
MRAVPPFRTRLVHELQVRLVDQAGRLERSGAWPVIEALVCDHAELLVHDRQEPVESFTPAAPQLLQDLGAARDNLPRLTDTRRLHVWSQFLREVAHPLRRRRTCSAPGTKAMKPTLTQR